MQPVHVIGVGMTPFGRHPDQSLRDLAVRAVTDALADAGIGAERIGAIAFANACLLYTSPSPRDRTRSRMPSSA